MRPHMHPDNDVAWRALTELLAAVGFLGPQGKKVRRLKDVILKSQL